MSGRSSPVYCEVTSFLQRRCNALLCSRWGCTLFIGLQVEVLSKESRSPYVLSCDVHYLTTVGTLLL